MGEIENPELRALSAERLRLLDRLEVVEARMDELCPAISETEAAKAVVFFDRIEEFRRLMDEDD